MLFSLHIYSVVPLLCLPTSLLFLSSCVNQRQTVRRIKCMYNSKNKSWSLVVRVRYTCRHIHTPVRLFSFSIHQSSNIHFFKGSNDYAVKISLFNMRVKKCTRVTTHCIMHLTCRLMKYLLHQENMNTTHCTWMNTFIRFI